MLPVVLSLIVPVVLLPFVGAIVSVRFEIDQHYLGIREIIPQQMINNPATPNPIRLAQRLVV